jgi:hypothetical protein
MKHRTGFVSNSSSTSFTVYGVRLDNWEEAECLAEKCSLSTFGAGPWSDIVYVGLCLAGEFEHYQRSDLKDNETKQDFMKRVVDLLPSGMEPGWYSESYYNG